MALPRDYSGQDCAVARTLEIVGERWTLLIVRDAFYGVTRFNDFQAHLDIPRAVLTERLNLLVEHGILTRAVAASGRDEYALTAKGRDLWPVIRALTAWGNEYCVPPARRRHLTHAGCGGTVTGDGHCAACDAVPPPGELTLQPRTGRAVAGGRTDPVSRVLASPHRLLEPVDTARTRAAGR
jgi:DNA-binding HxlR family transcriptional regulator